LKNTWLTASLGNAAPELRQNGWRVTLSNAESGVAAALAEAEI
jgi:hypothetical protein